MSGEWRCLARITRVYINRKYPYIRTARSFLCYLPALNPSLLPSQEATNKTIGDMADIRNSQLYCAARLFEVAHRYSRGDDSRACSRDAHINKLRQSVRNVRGASNYSFFIRPRSVREVSEMQFPCQSRRDRDIRLDHSRRKKLEKSNLRIRFKKVVDVR